MNAIKYLKLDLRIIKGKMKISLILPLFIGMVIISGTPIMGIAYLFLLLITFASMPFDSAISENSSKMYEMFPARVSNMVLGRFLYLISIILIIFGINGGLLVYLYKANSISMSGITGTLVSAIVAVIVCFCQYPIYYKVGLEKGKILSMSIYLIPAFSVFALTSVVGKDEANSGVNGVINFIINNRSILALVIVLICIIIGVISYSISCRICKKKEM